LPIAFGKITGFTEKLNIIHRVRAVLAERDYVVIMKVNTGTGCYFRVRYPAVPTSSPVALPYRDPDLALDCRPGSDFPRQWQRWLFLHGIYCLGPSSVMRLVGHHAPPNSSVLHPSFSASIQVIQIRSSFWADRFIKQLNQNRTVLFAVHGSI
jgi:hypothetical protein